MSDNKIVSDVVLIPFIDFMLMRLGDIKDLATLLKLYSQAIDALQQSSFKGALFTDYMKVLEAQMRKHRLVILSRATRAGVIYHEPTKPTT